MLAGACGAAVLWFLITVLYGFYVTRFAHYSLFYGSLGTVVATLVWLYITSLSVLMGADDSTLRVSIPNPRSPLAGSSPSRPTETGAPSEAVRRL